jgi:hypothetical protein
LLTFTSKPLTPTPHQDQQHVVRTSRAPKGVSTRTGTKANPDPKINQPRPEKKTRTTETQPEPMLHLITQPKPHDNFNDLEAQGEKKRRRDDETTVNPEPSNESMHFLTAGPCSQACRDQ